MEIELGGVATVNTSKAVWDFVTMQELGDIEDINRRALSTGFIGIPAPKPKVFALPEDDSMELSKGHIGVPIPPVQAAPQTGRQPIRSLGRRISQTTTPLPGSYEREL